jgi:methyl-accepting chemotaxis protein
MMKLENYHPYQKKVFWTIFLLAFGLTIIVAGLFYFFLSREALQQAQQNLEQVAIKTANLIPVATHEKLITAEDQKSDDYKLLELYLKSVMSGNPKIDDIYTLRPTDKPHVMTFVVSGKGTYDANHDGYLGENEQKAMLGEKYNTEAQPQLEEGLTTPGHDKKITYDKWGAWLSGYAPLKDASGKTVAVLGVDYAANTLAQENRQLLVVILWVILIMVPIYIYFAHLLSRRIQKPFRMMVKAMDRITHGEIDYQIPVVEKSEEGLLADFFNNMKNVLIDAIRRKSEEKNEKK